VRDVWRRRRPAAGPRRRRALGAEHGISDGIQVGVEPGFAAELGATNATEEALVDQA